MFPLVLRKSACAFCFHPEVDLFSWLGGKRGVRSAERRKCGVWITRSVEIMRSVDNAECRK